jgi:cyclopropane-fatty-acyl-phospholipid synthase
MLFAQVLKTIISRGRIVLIDAHGRRHEAGPGGKTGPTIEVRLTDPALPGKLLLNPHLHLGEAYMEGTLQVENGEIDDLLALIFMNLERRAGNWLYELAGTGRYLLRKFNQFNPAGRARRNVAHHYDLSGALYDTFLDAGRFYSCAYFEKPGDTLERAQAQKVHHIAAKLYLKPGQRILDIGSGWGGMAITLAKLGASHVKGITLSEEQLAYSRRVAEAQGIAERVEFALEDYRATEGPFDRIVSVGMFEHVGVAYYPAFFEKVRDLLTEDGVAVLHSIGRSDGPGATNPWINKYIFPGGYTPALSEVLPVIERAGLFVTDVEILRLHYAETLKEWRRRFRENWDRVATLYDERFCRMWEFYLAASEMAFRHQGLMVFQIQMAKRVDALPLTRDYITEWKNSHPVEELHLPRAMEVAAE